MFPSKFPILFWLQSLGVMVISGLVIIFLSNPLGLLGLLLLPEVPLVNEQPSLEQLMEAHQAGDDDPGYNESKAGFLSER